MSNNHVQKATGASPSGLTDSLLYDDGTNVGIGTTSPICELHVSGSGDNYIFLNSSSNSRSVVLGTNNGGGAAYLEVSQDKQTASKTWLIGVFADERFFIGHPGEAERMAILADGLFSINGSAYIGDASKGLQFDDFTAASEEFQRVMSVRQNMASTPRKLAIHSGTDSNGDYQDTFFARTDYASPNLLNKCPSMKFSGNNKLETFQLILSEYENPANIFLRRARTTDGGVGNVFTDEGTAQYVQSGDNLGTIRWQGLDDTNEYGGSFDCSAEILCKATEDCTSTDKGGELQFLTTQNGSATPTLRMIMTQDGLIGMGTASPSYELDVNGDIHYTSASSSSDARFKEDVAPLRNSLEKLKTLRTVSFRWNDTITRLRSGYKQDRRAIGLIAQDVEEVFPELVSRWKASKEIADARAVCYERFVPVLIDAIKELSSRLSAVEILVNADVAV